MILALLFILSSILCGYVAVKTIGFARSREEELFASIAVGLPLSAWLVYALFFVVGGFAALAALGVEAFALLFLRRIVLKPLLPAADGFWPRLLPLLIVFGFFFVVGAMHTNTAGDYEASPLFFWGRILSR